MIRQCHPWEFRTIHRIILEAAQAYRGIIPPDCWKDPYLSEAELHHEIRAGVAFWGYEKDGDLIGVMGIQHVKEVSLIRHAYVVPAMQKSGFGSLLLFQLKQLTTRPLLVGTWADVRWAIRFYEKHGFRIVSTEEKDRLLRAYWTISERQVETSVVLGDCTWFK